MVKDRFMDEIRDHVVNPEIRAAREAAKGTQPYTHELDVACRRKGAQAAQSARWKVLGYDGMSFEEREAAIKEKYAGKNTTMDFLRMQSELEISGVLYNKLGDVGMTTYTRDIIGFQFETAYNPNSIYLVGPEKCDFMTMDQWYRVANQPFDTAKFAAQSKELLSRMSFNAEYPIDFPKMIEDAIDRFMDDTMEDSVDRLMNGMEWRK